MTLDPQANRSPATTPADLLRTLIRRKWLLILPWAASIVAGVTVAFLLKPVYVSTTTMLLDRGQSMQGPLGGMGGGADVEQQAEIMREQVQSSLFLKSVIASTGIKSDAATRAWAIKSSPKYPSLTEDALVEEFLVDYLQSAVSIKRSKGKVFQITVEDFDPERARKFADAVANQFVASSKARQLEAVQAQQEFSVEQLQVYKRQLQEAESRLEAARRSAISSSIVGSAVNDRNYAFAQSLLEQAGIDADEQRQALAAIRTQAGSRLREADLRALSTPEVNSLSAQISSLERQLGSAMLTEGSAGAGSNVRVSLARKTGELEGVLGEAVAKVLPSASAEVRDLAVRARRTQADLAAKESWRGWLSGQINAYQHQMVLAPDRELDVTRLQAEVEQARSLYTTFQSQSAAAQIAEAFQNAKVSGRFVILEPANLPRSAAKPNRVMFGVLAFVIGGLVGIGLVLVVEQQDQSVKNADEVESTLGLPVLGAVPRVAELERSPRRGPSTGTAGPPGGLPAPRDHGLIHRLKVESPLGLEFRRIYLNLARARGRTLPRTLMITSSTRGEGKTTTSACLGITLAREHREKLLLVDFDLRSPTLHRALGLPSSSWGLSQMLQQRTFDERFVRQTALATMDFLSAGKSERPAAELVDAESVDWFLREATERYPLVVMDCPPNLAVPDPLILGRAVEGVLYVIKAGTTIRKAAEYGVRVQREARDNLIGVLMNDVGEYLPQYYGYKTNYYGYTPEAAG